MSRFSRYSGKVRVRASAILIHDSSLLLVRQNVPTRPGPVWLPPGGGVQLGERASDTVIREVKEETGLEVSPLRLRFVHEFLSPPFHATELYHLVSLEGGTLNTGSDPEHSTQEQLILETAFIPLSDLPSIELFPEFLGREIAEGNLMKSAISHFVTS